MTVWKRWICKYFDHRWGAPDRHGKQTCERCYEVRFQWGKING